MGSNVAFLLVGADPYVAGVPRVSSVDTLLAVSHTDAYVHIKINCSITLNYSKCNAPRILKKKNNDRLRYYSMRSTPCLHIKFGLPHIFQTAATATHSRPESPISDCDLASNGTPMVHENLVNKSSRVSTSLLNC